MKTLKYLLLIIGIGLLGGVIINLSSDKDTPDWTGTTQGEYVFDSIEDQREQDSIEAYLKCWYEVLDTNSNGDIDDTEHLWGGDNGETFYE
jgi:hypothetical protein|tara:strand:- start:26642 stop:26914 length:273 start_codon:yes stop_codon:yes gene_type:complete